MKLKKIEISGFKSFPHKSAIHFPPGVSAVVGPNGCGKSNIADALRWVMGEQSVKQLRGKSMEDVIFAGTKGAAPTNLAEVSLTLVNDNGSAPAELRDYAEIMLTRRLYRSGESAYLLNRRPCRLKDIQNIFLGSGLGPKSYAIIQQGNVGAIIEAGPDGLRYFLEEAAGITRYKSRKDEALRKVKQTNQNLLRLQDILLEIDRRMRGLQRQAKKAATYKRHQKRARQLDMAVNHLKLLSLAQALSDDHQNLTRLRDMDQADGARLATIEAAITEIKSRRWQKGEAISTLRNRQHEGQRQADRMESDLKHTRETRDNLKTEIGDLQQAKIDLGTKNEGLKEEIAQVEVEIESLNKRHRKAGEAIAREEAASSDLRQEAAGLKRELEKDKRRLMEMVAQEARINNVHQSAVSNRDSLQRRLRQIDEKKVLATQKVSALGDQGQSTADELAATRLEIEELNVQSGRLRRELGENTQALGAHVKASQTLMAEYNQTRSRLNALTKMERNYEWYRDGVKAVMQRFAPSPKDSRYPMGTSELGSSANTIKGLVADILAPDPGYERAAEVALGEALQYVIVETQSAGSMAIGYLDNQKAGRSGFIPLDTLKPNPHPLQSQEAPADRRPRLLQKIRVKDRYQAVAESLLGHVVLAQDLTQALAWHNRNGRRMTIVTPRGDLITPQGIMVGGAKGNQAGILARKNELRALAKECRQHQTRLQAAQKRQEEMEQQVRQLEADLQFNLEVREEIRLRETEIEKEAFRLAEELKHARHHHKIVQLEQEQLMGEELEFEAQIDKHSQALEDVARQAAQAQAAVDGTTARIETATTRLEQFNAQLVQMQLDQTAATTRLENQRSTLNRLQNFYADSQNRLENLTREIDLKQARYTAARDSVGALTHEIKAADSGLKELLTALADGEAEYQTIDGELQQNDSKGRQLRQQREQTQGQIRQLEMEQAQRQMHQENILRRMQERYNLTMEQIQNGTAGDDNAPLEDMSADEMEAQLEQLRGRMARMGEINLGAIQEYEEHKTRFEFLTTQKEDLETAIDDLHKVIRKINRISQERFLTTFEAVNEKLQFIFPKLFTGGTAQLVLTEPGKPLETGVEFMIHPPGKKVTRMSLLSGGEKALSAIAFIFAIFLIKPASFCLMDEIDAPLDDANVGRFNELLKVIGQESQIIMITHNKHSMEFADTLFGVTMEKKGISKIVSVNLEKAISEAA